MWRGARRSLSVIRWGFRSGPGFAVAFLAILFAPVAGAGTFDLPQAIELYESGAFEAAAKLAETGDSSESLTLAARSRLAYLSYVNRKAASFAALEGCAALAERAIAQDPRNVEAHLQYVVALGFMGRVAGNIRAHLAGYATDARTHLDTALRLDPENGWAHGMLGAWHMEIVRKGGAFLAGSIYGAKLDKGIALYQRALQLDPDNPVLHYEFGLALTAQDMRRFGTQAETQLRQALALPARNAFEQLAQQRAQQLLIALATRNRTIVAAAIRVQTEFPAGGDRAAEEAGPPAYGLR